MKLRPHHLLCTQGFSGKGYDDNFVKNMIAVTNYLRNNPNPTVEIVFSTDDICRSCPSKIGENLCEDQDKVNTFDKKVINYFGIEEKQYNYRDITSEINMKITSEIMDDICSTCSWYPISACKKNIVGKK